MQIGSYRVPEWRLENQVMPVLKKIYNAVKLEPIQSKDLSKLLGYKYGTEQTLFKTINSMLAYGVLEGRGIYNITKFGENLLFPESPEAEMQLKTQAFFNVGLWKKLYDIYGKNVPKEGLWVQLKNIADIDPATARQLEYRIFNWYLEDVNLVHDGYVQQPSIQEQTPSDFSSTEKKSALQQTIDISKQSVNKTRQNIIEIPFGDDIIIWLPKDNLEKAWEFAQEHMKLYLMKRALGQEPKD